MSQMSCSRGSLVCCKLVVLNEIATVWEKSRPMQYFSLQFTLIVHSESFLVKKQKNEEKAGTISARSYQSYSILSTVLVFSVSLNTCLFKKKSILTCSFFPHINCFNQTGKNFNEFSLFRYCTPLHPYFPDFL